MLACSIAAPTLLLAAPRQNPVEFSADVIRTVPGKEKPVSTGRMLVSRYGIRTEGKKNSTPVAIIFRPKKQVVWTLFPEQKIYEERKGLVVKRPALPTDPDSPCQLDQTIVCQLLGKVILRERPVEHWLVSRKTKKNLQPIVQLWVDNKLHVAIREKFVDGMAIELLNIELKAHSIKPFLVPDDYTLKPLVKPGKRVTK